MATEKRIVETPSAHPMESILGIEEGTTMVPSVQRTTELATAPEYDDKDKEIEGQFQEIYDLALEAFEAQAEEAELAEGRFKARNGEIAAQYLNTALNAAANKATMKGNKEKIRISARKLDILALRGNASVTNQNLIVGDRNEILRALLGKKTEIDITPDE